MIKVQPISCQKWSPLLFVVLTPDKAGFCKRLDIMRLECEGKAPIENPTPSQVIKIISSLRSYGPSSYASITDLQGSYLQVAGGGVTCLLEIYQSDTGKRLRAFGDTKNKAFPDGNLLVFRAGKIAMQSDEWFVADKIAEAFCNFLEGKELPKDIHWRSAPGF
jgi:hypothetical protein